MGWVLNETDYTRCFALFCTCQYNKLIELKQRISKKCLKVKQNKVTTIAMCRAPLKLGVGHF